jgi:hypothetical protein
MVTGLSSQFWLLLEKEEPVLWQSAKAEAEIDIASKNTTKIFMFVFYYF